MSLAIGLAKEFLALLQNYLAQIDEFEALKTEQMKLA